MTHHVEDNRVIEDAPQYNATLVRRVDHTADLASFWVRFDGEPIPFEPGQYMTTGVFVDGKLRQRPYSVASPPQVAGTEGYEFYVRLVPVIRFTTVLWRLPIGHRMRMIGPKGKFLLEPNDAGPTCTCRPGTGIAPFMSMIRDTRRRGTAAQDGRPPRLLVRRGARLPRVARGAWSETRSYPLRYVPTISRPNDPRNDGWTGRTGRAERVVATSARTSGCDPTGRSSTSAATRR